MAKLYVLQLLNIFDIVKKQKFNELLKYILGYYPPKDLIRDLLTNILKLEQNEHAR